jgi:hypothetical protein
MKSLQNFPALQRRRAAGSNLYPESASADEGFALSRLARVYREPSGERFTASLRRSDQRKKQMQGRSFEISNLKFEIFEQENETWQSKS